MGNQALCLVQSHASKQPDPVDRLATRPPLYHICVYALESDRGDRAFVRRIFAVHADPAVTVCAQKLVINANGVDHNEVPTRRDDRAETRDQAVPFSRIDDADRHAKARDEIEWADRDVVRVTPPQTSHL